MIPISVVIPVGPAPFHRQWLTEAIQSVEAQASASDEIVLINDGGAPLELSSHACQTQVYTFPTNIGCVGAWNTGVSIARNEHVLFLGADDRLLPGCLDGLRMAWYRSQDPLGYYFLAVDYEDGRTQNVPCQAAMVTKTLWRYTGGFPLEAALGAIDNIFVQMLLSGGERGVSRAKVYSVSPQPLYWYRPHALTETVTRSQRWFGVIAIVRDDLSAKWLPREGVE